MALGMGCGTARPLLFVNFILYMVGACLAGWGLNRNVDSQIEIGENIIGDYSTTWFLPLALMACMMGLASVLAGVRHLFLWKADSLAVAAAASLIAWILDLLAMGTPIGSTASLITSVHVSRFAAKEVDISGGWRPGKLKVLEAFIIVLAILELFNLLLLHEPSSGTDSVNMSVYNQGNMMCNQPNMIVRPSLYNQVGGSHMHHHHPHGSISGHSHAQQPSSPC